MVASLMRSGTHLAIDLVLNNLATYRRTPLYVDIDRYFRMPEPLPDFVGLGSTVIKTHYPQIAESDEAEATISRLAAEALVVQPVRDLDAVYRSLRRFGYPGSRDELNREANRFNAFWNPFSPLRLSFARLADPQGSREALEAIAAEVGLSVPPSPKLSPLKSHPWSILTTKAITRLLGRRAPRVNTSIQLTTGPRD